MLVELVGSTGAGKSTIAEHLVQSLRARGCQAVTSDRFVLQSLAPRIDGVRWQPLRSVLVDLLVLPWCLRFGAHHARLCWFVIRIAWRDIELAWFRLNVYRNVAKQMGISEFLKTRVSADQVVVLDEGLLHQAHSLFVHPLRPHDTGELSTFVNSIPLSDVVVLVEAPTQCIVRRTLARGHPRLPGHRIVQANVFVERAEYVFRSVVHLAATRTRTKCVWNDEVADIDAALAELVTCLA